MRVFLATTCIVAGSLLAAGCATKKYVRNTTAPIQAKVDQVGTQTTQNTQQIEDTKGQLKQVDDKAQSGITPRRNGRRPRINTPPPPTSTPTWPISTPWMP
jgi:outer membrane murein-binding lipoprotein Lpp